VKPIAEQLAAIIEPSYDQIAIDVRDAASLLRHAEVLETKAADRATESKDRAQRDDAKLLKQRDDVAAKRLALGQLLVKMRSRWPTSGPRSKGWGEFLSIEGIEQQRAWELMKLANYVEISPSFDDAGEIKIPTLAEAGIDRRPRQHDRNTEEQPDSPFDDAASVEIISAGCALNIHLGDWRQVLADVGKVDTIITDPPYGATTHESIATRDDGGMSNGLTPDYEHWTSDDICAFVEYWAVHCRGWIVALTSDDLIPDWKAAYRANGLTAFAPVPCVITGMTNRMQGDGPSSWSVYAMVARPKHLVKWRTTPGAYVGGRVSGSKSGRGKPPWLMEAIVHDYSNPGDLVCDPMAGYGETLLAANRLARRQIGAELVDTARREAIKRFHDRKNDPLPTFDPNLPPTPWES
jgi:hypothetical protein